MPPGDPLPRAGEIGEVRETRPGRPRDPQVDRAIIAATLKLLADQGYRGMSVERVAEEAGVGKTTIYRRYASKEELVVAAMSTVGDRSLPLPDRGSLAADLAGMMEGLKATMDDGLPLLGALLVEEGRNPGLMELFRERILRPRRDAMTTMLERSAGRGEIRSGIDLEAAGHAIVGSILVRRLHGIPESEEWIARTVEIISGGVMADPAG